MWKNKQAENVLVIIFWNCGTVRAIIRMCWGLWRSNVSSKSTHKLGFSSSFLFLVALPGATRENILLKCFSKLLSLLQNLIFGCLIALDRRQLAQETCDVNETGLPLASSLPAPHSQLQWSSQHCGRWTGHVWSPLKAKFQKVGSLWWTFSQCQISKHVTIFQSFSSPWSWTGIASTGKQNLFSTCLAVGSVI